MIDSNDLTKQEKVYTRGGKGRWAVLGYCPTPSVTMIDLDTGERVNFGLGGAMNNDFEETGETYDRGEIPRQRTVER